MQIHPDLVEIALEKVEGFAFERFGNDFLAAVEGRKFIPLGGVHDGGADGMGDTDGLFETDSPGIYYQISVQKTHRPKIQQTIDRLQKFKREPKAIYYFTSIDIPHIDQEEDRLSEQTGVRIKIRAKKYIVSHINSSDATVAAYEHHLARYTDHLRAIGKTRQSKTVHVDDPSVYVFLQQEVANRLGNRKLIHSVTDTLILWALRDTDPDTGKFLKANDIQSAITSTFPWSKQFIKSNLTQRLEAMRSKNTEGRELRWYRKEGKYCIPLETRESIKAENSEDESLRLRFFSEIQTIASEIVDEDEIDLNNISDCVSYVLTELFEREGLLLSSFITQEQTESRAPLIVADCIEDILTKESIDLNHAKIYRSAISTIIDRVFYSSTETQRKYLGLLSRTYVLLFTLKAEPRILEYFSTMNNHFKLFVGSDILVKALSERYLGDDDKASRNLLKAASDCGMTLYLSDCVLDEVSTHLRNTHYEFSNHIAGIESYITKDLIDQSRMILIRAYFYAKERKQVRGWREFIGQYLTYENVGTSKGKEELKKYLIAEYGLTFIDNSGLQENVATEAVDKLTQLLLDENVKDNEILAYNTSLLVHGIYGLRKRNKEDASASPFGLSTWWLTNQTKIQKHTSKLVHDNHAKYIMQPEFILNFLALAPSCQEVRKSYKGIFPSSLSIQLGHHLKEDVFHTLMERVKDWSEHSPARVQTMIGELSDELKSERRTYEESLDSITDKLDRIM